MPCWHRGRCNDQVRDERAAFAALFVLIQAEVGNPAIVHMLVTTKAIVFSALRYGEADLIVRCFTRENGIKTYLLRGVMKSRKGKLRSSLFQVLTQLEIVAWHREKGNLEYIKEARVTCPYKSLHTDVVKSTVLLFLAEVLRSAVREEEANPALFDFMENAFSWFDTNSEQPNFHLLFLVELTRYLGFYPDHGESSGSVFDLIEGTFRTTKTGNGSIEDENVVLLRRLLGTDFDALTAVRLNQSARSEFLQMLLTYYQIHLQGFQKPRSFAVLNEIYR